MCELKQPWPLYTTPSITPACCLLLLLKINVSMRHFQNVPYEVNCSFYLTKAGDMQMLGTVEMENDQTGKVWLLFLLFLLLVSLHLRLLLHPYVCLISLGRSILLDVVDISNTITVKSLIL